MIFSIVHLLVLILAPEPVVDMGAAAVRLASLRMAYYRSLDAAGWDRRDPAVMSLANADTAEALALAATVPALRDEARGLATTLAGDALGELIRRDPQAPVGVIAAYLAQHPDLAVLHDALAAGVSATSLGMLLADDGNPAAGEVLTTAYTTADAPTRERLCDAARALRPQDRRSMSLAVSHSNRPSTTETPSCVALLGRSLVNPTGHTGPVRGRNPVAEHRSATFEQMTETERLAALDLVVNAHDVGLIDRAWAALANPHLPASIQGLAMLALAFDLPAHDAPALQHAVQALQSLAQEIHDFSVIGVSPRPMEVWVDALTAAGRCDDVACLHGLIRDGSDEAAARAVAILGAHGISELPLPVARMLIRRVAMGDAPHLEAVVLAKLEGCPPQLRGLPAVMTYRSPLSSPAHARLRALRAQCWP